MGQGMSEATSDIPLTHILKIGDRRKKEKRKGENEAVGSHVCGLSLGDCPSVLAEASHFLFMPGYLTLSQGGTVGRENCELHTVPGVTKAVLVKVQREQ